MRRRRKVTRTQSDVAWGRQVQDGEPFVIHTATENYHEKCCDCGLVHRIRFEVYDEVGDRVQNPILRVFAWRHNLETKIARRDAGIRHPLEPRRRGRRARGVDGGTRRGR